MDPADLCESERSVWAAFPLGRWVDLRTGSARQNDLRSAGNWGEERTVRAEVIAALLLGAVPAEPGHVAAVRLRGARITGRLDVMGATVSCALVCENCWFDTELRLVEATTKTVSLVGSRLAGYDGTRMRAEGLVSFYRTVVDMVLRLDRANVAGEVCLREMVAGQAVAASGLTVDGDLDCAQLTSHGPVELVNARISGSVSLADVKVSCRDSPALNATNSVIGAGLSGDRMEVDGETRLRHARISGSLSIFAGQLRNSSGAALGAGGLTVEGGGVWLRDLCAAGEIRLVGARLGANLALSGAELSNPGGTALNLERAVLSDLDAAGLVVSAGTVRLIGAQIASRVNLADAQLDAGHAAIALDADGAAIGRRLILSRADIRGQVSAVTSQVGARVLLQDARIENPGRIGLQFSRIDVATDMLCTGLTVAGETRLSGARVGHHLDLTRARLVNPGGTALDAWALQATEISLAPAEPIQGSVILSHARIGILRDDPQHWPDLIHVGGLTYEALEPPLPARQRLAWLRRDPGSHSPQPYEQLAALYTRIGQAADARQVLYASEQRRPATRTLPGRAWSLLQDITVGYGYRPARAAAWLAALLLIGSITYAVAPPPPLSTTGSPHFNPVIYTLDLMLPVADLGQKHAFNPAGLEQWLSYLLTAAGWILATTIAASIARIITRR